MNASILLRWLAVLAFTLGVVICLVDDTPDVFEVYAAALAGLGLYVASTLVKS